MSKLVLCVALALALAERARTFPACKQLELRYQEWADGAMAGARARRVELACGGAPACAAANLLRALLVHTYFCTDVSVSHYPLRLKDLAEALPPDPDWLSPLVVIAVSTAWVPRAPAELVVGQRVGLAGPRLREFGASSVPARRRLFVRLAPLAPPEHCAARVASSFYADAHLLRQCHFADEDGTSEYVPVYVVWDPVDVEIKANEEALKEMEAELRRRAAAAALRLRLERCNRTVLLRALSGARSLLFFDFDLWEDCANVSVVQPPPCADASPCEQELDPAVSMRVGDFHLLAKDDIRFKMRNIIDRFRPTLPELRQILESESDGSPIEEAACDWALENDDRIRRWRNVDGDGYLLLVFYCRTDSSRYSNSFNEIEEFMRNETAHPLIENQIKVKFTPINCTDRNELRDELRKDCESPEKYYTVGALVPESEGAAEASVEANRNDLPLVMYGVADEHASGWTLAPRRLSSLALSQFLRANGWSRVAVVSEATAFARRFFEDLQNGHDLRLRDVLLDLENLNPLFNELRGANARIVFINAGSAAAAIVLNEAIQRGMSADGEYAWLVREWHGHNDTRGVRHFTVSPWSASARGGSARLRALAAAAPAPLVDALAVLLAGVRDVWRRAPRTKDDMRQPDTITELELSLHEHPVEGSMQRLQFKNRSVETSCMYVEEWRGARRRLLATWRVNASARSVTPLRESERGALAAPPHDGAARCLLPGAGDAFAPPCRDWAAVCGLLALVLAPLAGWLARRHVRRRLERRDRELLARMRAGRDRVASVLADKIVDRSALEMQEELGAGQFGRVWRALLRAPGRATCAVAAKALHDGATPAEESDFLREACTLATLHHPHVLRLVGVCVDGGPPVMLTEVAFFGDLLEYLIARRHLAAIGEWKPPKSGSIVDEAAHVSAESLTRLVREAASALAYLAASGVVHRDVRAANCLIDSTRSLKLGDFGMARDTGATEYLCVRRTLVPVLWMAPESLTLGVFSSASDVWALGVLVLEAVSLGARPFGGMAPGGVLRYVSAGGAPPLPLDASPATRALAALCWRRVAAERPSAAAVEAYLAARPSALCPALAPGLCGFADSDSGFGEPASPVSLTASHCSF